MTGLSDVIGSWKIIEIRLPLICRISASVASREIAVLEQNAALGNPPDWLCDKAHDRLGGDALAAAGLPDKARRISPRMNGKVDAPDRVDEAARLTESATRRFSILRIGSFKGRSGSSRDALVRQACVRGRSGAHR